MLDGPEIPPGVILVVIEPVWTIVDHVLIPIVQDESTGWSTTTPDLSIQTTPKYNSKDQDGVIERSTNAVNVPVRTFRMNGRAASCFRAELLRSQAYRRSVWNCLDAALCHTHRLHPLPLSSPLIVTEIHLRQPKKEFLDYRSCGEAQRLIREAIEMDYIMSWLSTLGGAFSSLGDQFIHCAETAGRISVQQFKIALKLGDPATLTRCQLYLSISLIQCGRLREARHLIRNVYSRVVSQQKSDTRLVAMCLGIWAKLQYEWHKRRCSASPTAPCIAN